MQKTIPIVIPYFNAPEKIKLCLEAIERQNYKPVEVFIRDNSIDNILFTAAINEGLEKFCYREDVDYILILNQDAYLELETIERLLECMEKNPKCGIASPIQISPSSNKVVWGGSYEAFPLGRHRQDPLETYTQDIETYWANGTAMLIRTSLIKKIGLLDENMRFVCSDCNYSLTARARGWSVLVASKAHVKHETSSSGARLEISDLEITKAKDFLYFAQKWITGDLYKQISFEGDSLSKLKVKSVVSTLQSNITFLSK